MAIILDRCIERYNDISENLQRLTTSDPSSLFPNPETVDFQTQKSFPVEPQSNQSPIGSPTSTPITDSLPQSPAVESEDSFSDFATIIHQPIEESPPAGLHDTLPIHTFSREPHVLVTDDNAINRKVSIIISDVHSSLAD